MFKQGWAYTQRNEWTNQKTKKKTANILAQPTKKKKENKQKGCEMTQNTNTTHINNYSRSISSRAKSEKKS